MSVKISIITATWKCAETIDDCLDSVAEQTWENREHVVIDGASPDETMEKLNARRKQLAVLISEADKGIYDALNKGIANASGDVVGFLHADDLYAGPDVLAKVAESFSDPTVGAVYGDLQYVSKNNINKVIRNWKAGPFSQRRLAWGWMPPHPTLYLRREWYQKIGGFDTRYKIAADYFSILSLFTQADLNPVYLPEIIVKMRLGGVSNRSVKTMIQKSREDLDALRRTGVGGLGALLVKNVGKLPQFF